MRKSKIFIMDEATAYIDHNTEKKIESIINSEFKGSTILTITHRLQTILGYDKVLVLNKGQIVEFDTPKNLMADEKTYFYDLIQKSDIQRLDNLQED